MPSVETSASHISEHVIAAATEKLRGQQPLHDQTRSTHAAGFIDHQGQLLSVREDVGRHNALDKLIGAMAQQNLDPSAGAVVMTSRLSLELVQKTAMLGCGMLIAVSAPTVAALKTAERTGLTTIGLARDQDFECFTHPHRIVP